MKIKLISVVLCLIMTKPSLSQAYLGGTLSNNSAGGNLIVKDKQHYLGFGVSFFRNKGNKGQDFTNFIQPNSDVYEILNSQDGSIYASYGRKYRNTLISLRSGAGTRKWIYNGETNGKYWFIYRDGGTYLLYGAEIRKLVKKVGIGLSYDNINKGSITVSYRFANK